jgi:hypothetical protein
MGHLMAALGSKERMENSGGSVFGMHDGEQVQADLPTSRQCNSVQE